MTFLLVAIIFAQMFVLGWVAWVLGDVLSYARETHTQVMLIKRTRRTRQTQASMQSGTEPSEKQLVNLGRASRNKRVVVGGDPDSPLYQEMSRGIAGDDHNE
jgi:hypothetical protein